MPETYPDCYFCGGEVLEERIVREVWREGTLRIIENVPAGVCTQCGEKYVTPQIARQIDNLLENAAHPDHILQVPAYAFQEAGTRG